MGREQRDRRAEEPMYAQPPELRLAMERLAGEGGCDPHSAFRNMDVTVELGGPRMRSEPRGAI